MLLQERGPWYHEAEPSESLLASLDPQWLDLAVESGRLDLVQVLARPGHAGANALLAGRFHERLGKSKSGNDSELYAILVTMIRIGHPGATDAAIELIKRSARAGVAYGYYWIGHVIPRLPKAEAVPKLEALLPTLPEKMVDQVLDVLNAMK